MFVCCVIARLHSQDADTDIKMHVKLVNELRDVARILTQELVAGLLSLLVMLLTVFTAHIMLFIVWSRANL